MGATGRLLSYKAFGLYLSPCLVELGLFCLLSFRLLKIYLCHFAYSLKNAQKGIRKSYRFVCADAPDKYSSRVMESDENFCFNLAVSLNDFPGAMGRCCK